MNLQRAIEIAVAAHAKQTDKQGQPYVTHPLRLMNAVETDAARIVAVLHDVVEDTDVTFDSLAAAGFDNVVLAALKLLTHDKSVPYANYVTAIKSNATATSVKLADLRDNTRLDRMLLRPAKADDDFRRIHRYLLSHQFLTDQLNESEYRAMMMKFG